MDTTTTLTFGERLQGTFEQLYRYVPALFGALVILFAGYLLARLLEKGTDRLMRRIHLNQILERGGVMQAVERSGSRVNPTRVAGSLVFWFVMFAVLLVAANALGLQSLANVFSELVSYIPSVIAAIVIMIVGIVLGSFVGGLIMASAGGLHGGPTLARAGKGGVVLLATFMALQELGVATEIVTTAFAILFGAIALALSLAFGLGNRELAGEVTRNWYRRYKDERDSIERENHELDKVEGIATTEEYVQEAYAAGIRRSGPHDVFRPREVSSTAAASPEPELTTATTELLRALSLRDAIALVLSVIGTGIFLKTAQMAQLVDTPSRVLLAWLAAGLLSLAGALTYAELGAMLPEAGGDYVFLREAYGNLVAFLFGWTNLVLIATGSVAAVSTALASFLASFVPLDAVWVTRDVNLLGQVIHWRLGIQQLVAVAVILLFSAINAKGLAAGARVQWIATVAKLGGIAIIVFGAFVLSKSGSWDHLRAPATAGVSGGGMTAFGAAMLAALWAYQGWSNVSMVAGEIEKPERNVPRALIYGMLLVILVYLLTNVAYFYALPYSEIVTSNSTAYRDALPVAAKAAQTFFSYGAHLVSLAFIICVIGALNGIILMNARVPFAMARNGLFFRRLGELNPDSRVPVAAIWTQAIWACVLALSGTFDQITTSVMFALWVFFALVGASLFVLRRKLPAAPRRYRTPGYPVVSLLFVLVAVWLVVNSVKAYPVESVIGLALIALGLPLYLYFHITGRQAHESTS